jgi:catechol 2,3-dioxygenase-like lactoylglutathione lyase family enzyme
MTETGIVILYRWRLRTGHEAQFKEAWSVVTRSLIERGSLGSRLHVGNDGVWYAYAQWPSAEARTAAFAQPLGVDEAQRAMADAVLEHFPEIVLTPSVDHLISTPPVSRMRVARPTTDIERAITFWTQVVGLEILSRFEDHEGYDGVILGNSGDQWEIEVTHHSSGMPLPSPSEEDIIVLYLNRELARGITDRLRHAGHPPKEHPNPYWQAMRAFVHTDPDGYTLIIFPNE